MKKIQKRHVFLFLLFAALAAFGLIVLPKTPTESEPVSLPVIRTSLRTASPTATPTPLDAYRERRYQERADAALSLQALAETETGELGTQASQAILNLHRQADLELAIEGDMLAFGYPGAVAVVRDHSATLIVPGKKPDAQEAAALILAVVRHTQLEPEQIAIMCME